MTAPPPDTDSRTRPDLLGFARFASSVNGNATLQRQVKDLVSLRVGSGHGLLGNDQTRTGSFLLDHQSGSILLHLRWGWNDYGGRLAARANSAMAASCAPMPVRSTS